MNAISSACKQDRFVPSDADRTSCRSVLVIFVSTLGKGEEVGTHKNIGSASISGTPAHRRKSMCTLHKISGSRDRIRSSTTFVNLPGNEVMGDEGYRYWF